MTTPLSTYRLQFRAEFGFDDAAAIAGYLADLGITHVYASPYLQAAPGSAHGYDVVDHSRVNDELGGAPAHERMCKALKAADIGQILDIVPNHMAIPGPQNAWWWDVLKHGVTGEYAAYFDIDWRSPEEKLHNVVLMPVLGDHYGRVLDRNEITVEGDRVVYFDHQFPLDPATVPNRDINGDADAIDALLQQQHYRLAHWRVAADELDYRRFFDINSLVALRTENDNVFAATHRLVFEWIQAGVVDGLRVDHIDGLRDPAGYLHKVRNAVGPDAYVIVEKILEGGERLPASWPVAGTTGYDSLNRVDGLFIEPNGEAPLTSLYEELTRAETDFRSVARTGKTVVVERLLHSDVERLTEQFVRVTENHRRFRDFTRAQLRTVIQAMLVAFPVYRSYAAAATNQVTQADDLVVGEAAKIAVEQTPDIDADLLQFFCSILTLRTPGEAEGELAMRFQQLSGPVMAKGVEDTAFYRYFRFASLNEVGGDPATFSLRPDDFHATCSDSQKSWPVTMLASTTHDTKRSEDTRARLAVLSEVPAQWAAAVRRWSALNERYRRPVDAADPDGQQWPDRNDEYLLYQTLVGAHPIDADRLVAYVAKAANEAKVHTSWTEPDPAYDGALRAFVQGICSNNEFVHDLEEFVEPLVEPGRQNSLSATALKLTMPGVPDVYQGTELWTHTLVDPDNRQAVNYEIRRKLLGELRGLSPAEILQRSDEGLPKLFLTHALLQLRKRRPATFGAQGTYEPLWSTGRKSAHVVAFSRGDVVTIAPRLTFGLANDWADTTLRLPTGSWTDVFTGASSTGGDVALDVLLADFPVAVLEMT